MGRVARLNAKATSPLLSVGPDGLHLDSLLINAIDWLGNRPLAGKNIVISGPVLVVWWLLFWSVQIRTSLVRPLIVRDVI
uniref:Uncharacterized protein n=1 Tax=Caenorhabditis japonica TaxID=281687 RepID=A0A8R1IVI3_CAEJA